MRFSAISRRRFCCSAGLLGAGTVLWLAGCGRADKDAAPKPAPAAATADPCADLSGLTPDEIALRGTFGYVAQAEEPELACDRCEFWEAPQGDAPCGGCTLFPGPVHPGGSCDSFSEA